MRTQTLLAVLVIAPLLTGLGFSLDAAQPDATATATTSTAATEYKIDAGHSHVLFRTTHLGLSYAHGRFKTFSGKFTLGDGASIQMEIVAGSVDTQNEKREGHLTGPDFFNAGEYPKITFASTAIEDKGDGKFAVTGTLELLGKPREISFEAIQIGEGDDPWGGYRAGLHASFTIKRSDFGMNWGIDTDSVGDEVLLEISVEGTRE